MKRTLTLGILMTVSVISAAVSSAAAQGAVGQPAVGYWTESETVLTDVSGEPVRSFPLFDHFSFTSSLLAGERPRDNSRDRVVGYDPVSGARLFVIRNATNPVVSTRGHVFFSPTFRREEYVMSIWKRGTEGNVRKIVQFKPGPGLPGIRHGMEAGGGPLDVAVDRAGRFAAVVFGLETVRAFDVWIVDTRSKEATRMTRGENSHNPSLSPDGERLAVRVERTDACPDPTYGEILIGKIRVISRVTGERNTLTSFDCDLFFDTPRWVDNETLVAIRVTKDATEANGYDLDLVRIDPSSGAVTELVTEGNPCCITTSPTLRKVAFSFSDRTGFAVYDIDTTEIEEFPSEASVPHLAGESRF